MSNSLLQPSLIKDLREIFRRLRALEARPTGRALFRTFPLGLDLATASSTWHVIHAEACNPEHGHLVRFDGWCRNTATSHLMQIGSAGWDGAAYTPLLTTVGSRNMVTITQNQWCPVSLASWIPAGPPAIRIAHFNNNAPASATNLVGRVTIETVPDWRLRP